MDTIKALKERRSIRHYKDIEVPVNILKDIIDCGRLAPSGHNKQPWKFVITTDRTLKEKISEAAQSGRFILNAGACISVFCDPVSETFQEDAFAATENILIAAYAHGLSSCWVNSYRKDHSLRIKELLEAPDSLELMSLLAIGYGETPPTPDKKPLNEVLLWQKFKP